MRTSPRPPARPAAPAVSEAAAMLDAVLLSACVVLAFALAALPPRGGRR